jgi:hypothetical protein
MKARTLAHFTELKAYCRSGLRSLTLGISARIRPASPCLRRKGSVSLSPSQVDLADSDDATSFGD